MLNKLTLEEKIGQMFMIGFKGITIPKRTQTFINDKNIGGIILFSRNIDSIDGVIGLNNELHSLAKISPMIWTDQEGGNIVRFSEMAATGISHMGITATNNPKNSKTIASLIAKDMKLLGLDGVFAPVLDVNINENNPVIGIRSFSNDPDTVVKYAEEFIKGLKSEAIASCGKHFPGHGAASADSHLEIPEIILTKKIFDKFSIFPFLKLSDRLDAIMTAHVKYTNISDEIGTFSNELISGRLKKRSNFKGVVFSDCIEMKAITDNYTNEEIVLNSISAGIDVLIISHTYSLQEKLYNIALNLVKTGKIKESRIDESVSRILKLKSKYNIQKRTQNKSTISKIRKNINIEREIALSSIQILKNNKNILPLKEDSKTLFVEYSNQISEPAVLSEKSSKLEKIAKKLFINGTTQKLKISDNLENYIKNVNNFENIVIFIYSFTGESKSIVLKTIEDLFHIRNDLIVISLENPYEINNMSFINTFICTYGFREIQIEAVLKTLTIYQKNTRQIQKNE